MKNMQVENFDRLGQNSTGELREFEKDHTTISSSKTYLALITHL